MTGRYGVKMAAAKIDVAGTYRGIVVTEKKVVSKKNNETG